MRRSHVPMSHSQPHPQRPALLCSLAQHRNNKSRNRANPHPEKQKDLPRVPRPPIGIVPNLLNGTENVTTFGVTSRITMTFAGSVGINLEDILLLLSLSFDNDGGDDGEEE